MESVILIVHVLLAVAVVALVLLQQGKGAEAGAAFGGGASQTVFGSQGSKSFLGRLTAVVAAGIFASSFALAVFAKQKAENVSGAGIPAAEVIESAAQAQDEPELPALESEQAGDKAATDIPVAE
ncbi:preprotein translocase subunit SecG [Marinobacterium stanieri]|jgi:preprotein translocase subunit SecG|uniref:Protein-export membrane protein SecG n=1 Tax=Marinobacterium stanieri TaxID=49186 RepID=A0A1N6XNL4_9GAMM|nr:preprotein translocase subunit SecG [Marinobacterium stanieri]SIR03966.1 protein translocase subunit secG [Marinobacterium stanieri]